jgi:hypothetical protein
MLENAGSIGKHASTFLKKFLNNEGSIYINEDGRTKSKFKFRLGEYCNRNGVLEKGVFMKKVKTNLTDKHVLVIEYFIPNSQD